MFMYKILHTSIVHKPAKNNTKADLKSDSITLYKPKMSIKYLRRSFN